MILLTGPAGAGKSAVSEAICERFDRMLHVEVDTLRHWVKAGYRAPWLDEPQAEEQLLLAVRNAAAIARNAIALRYSVVIDDVIFSDTVERYREALRGIDCHVHFALLLPDLETTLARDAARPYSVPERARALHEALAQQSEAGVLPGVVLDSTHDADAARTADRVLDAVAAGEALFIEQGAG